MSATLLQPREEKVIDIGGSAGIRLRVVAYATPEDILLHLTEGYAVARARSLPVPGLTDPDLRRAMTEVVPIRRG